jgi:hypothetical protein
MKSGTTSTTVYQGGNEYDVSFRFTVDGDMVDYRDVEVDGRPFGVEDLDDAWLEQMDRAAHAKAAQICW